jgi:hypothetical protein
MQVDTFMLMRNVRDLLRHPLDPSSLLESPPLVVLNNFGATGKHITLMTQMLQGLFPAIDVATVRLAACRRVVLFNLDKVCDRAHTYTHVSLLLFVLLSSPLLSFVLLPFIVLLVSHAVQRSSLAGT